MIDPWIFIGKPHWDYEAIVPGDAIVPGTIVGYYCILLNSITSLVVKNDVKKIASTVN